MKKLSLIVMLAFWMVNGANAQLKKVDQTVYGMDCAPCAYGLENGLKKIQGVEKVKVSLNDGKAYLDLPSDNTLTLQKIQEEVKENGFSAREAKVTLKGELQEIGNDKLIKVHGESFHITANTDEAIVAALKPGIIQVKGIVKDKKDDQLDNDWDIQLTQIIEDAL